MGRFETPVEFYRYREPYPDAFFDAVAARLGLNRGTRLLDVGCGPGILAIGFAPFAGNVKAIDPERAMLRAARAAAAQAHVEIEFFETGIEELHCEDASFDFVTIGRALHWLQREAATAVLERVVARDGRIAVCGSRATNAPVNNWNAIYKEVRNQWASVHDEARYRPDLTAWFAPSRFRQIDEITVEYRHTLPIDHLVARALSFSVTSIEVLGKRRPEFENIIRAALAPFAKNGTVEEEVSAIATVFA